VFSCYIIGDFFQSVCNVSTDTFHSAKQIKEAIILNISVRSLLDQDQSI